MNSNSSAANLSTSFKSPGADFRSRHAPDPPWYARGPHRRRGAWKELVENTELFAGEKKASALQPWASGFYTVTHLLFAGGVLAVTAALAIYGPTK